MKLSTYLIPVIWYGSIPIEYRYEKRKKDMRTNFCKRNKQYETTDCIIDSLAYEHDAIVTLNSLSFADTKNASLFFEEMKEGGWYNEKRDNN